MDSYDYVVVGAGSAGCVVARRLSDDPKVRVLLLEAGPEPSGFWLSAPAGMARLIRSERFNWRFNTEPVPTLRNRSIYWPRGKVLGGSSAINGMVHVRGHRRDFDEWARLGNPGWAWRDVLPFFQRAEDNQRGPGQERGAGGPLAVSDPVFVHPSALDFIAAARRYGIAGIDDFEAGGADGVGISQFNIKNGRRQSGYDAYLRPVLRRSNLTIAPNTALRRVVFEGREAVGVEVNEGGATRFIRSRREVILSAGALGSPQLLMLSGIGDGEALRRYDIPVVVHAPGVGRNLQDHFNVRVQFSSTPESSYNRDLRGWRKYWQGAQYLFLKRGYLTLGSSPVAAFVRSGPTESYADLEISFRPMTFNATPSGSVEADPAPAMSASIYRVRPASRGEVRLRSPNPSQPPAIIPNYLGHPEDISATLSGIRQLRAILATEPLASRVRGEILPGETAITDEQLIDYMEREGQCAFHPAGSCKMGNDAMAVVDERLRVHGVERLRIIDASIMPVVTSGNTNAPTVMIGEKGADMIRADAVEARLAL